MTKEDDVIAQIRKQIEDEGLKGDPKVIERVIEITGCLMSRRFTAQIRDINDYLEQELGITDDESEKPSSETRT